MRIDWIIYIIYQDVQVVCYMIVDEITWFKVKRVNAVFKPIKSQCALRLDKGTKLKLSDYALARDLFPHDYHCLADNEFKPVHWMSLETLRHQVYTTRTDIWTCGVAIWECLSFAMQPYEHVDPFEFVDYLLASDANRLANPLPNFPLDVYACVERCWRADPIERPTLKELFTTFHHFYNSLKTYVWGKTYVYVFFYDC